MEMHETDWAEFLKLMEQEEILAERKYRFAAARAGDEGLRKALLDLAHEETVHRDLLRNLHERLTSK